MSKEVSVTFPADEAMFVIAALDERSADAHAKARKMRALGYVDGNHFELDVAHAAATKCDRARKRIADALWPMDIPKDMRRADLEDEVEFGLV